MSGMSELDIARHNAEGEGKMDRSVIEWKLSQLVEDFAAAISPLTIDQAMREAYVSDVDMTAALLSQVSYGAVIADVCEKLGVTIPWTVRRAVGDEPTPLNAA